MNWLNYHHLFYFYKVAELKSVTKAASELRLSQPTVSAQLKSLEDQLGIKLFEKSGRNLQLTSEGLLVYRYAQEIFALGKELQFSVAGKDIGKKSSIKIGISDTLPKIIISKILSPFLNSSNQMNLICIEGSSDKLLAELALQELHLVISDCPVPPHVKVKAYSHHIGSSEVMLAASPKINIKNNSKNTEELLGKYPLMLPTKGTALRNELNAYFAEKSLIPNIIAEFQDSALMKIAAVDIPALLPVPAIVADEIKKLYGLKMLAKIPKVTEPLYIISVERQIKEHCFKEIIESARKLFK